MINISNWNYTSYKAGELEASITIGGSLKNTSVEINYFLTVVDEDYQTVFQQDFSDLSDALTVVNKKYRDWTFNDKSQGSSDSGCGTCSAH